MHEISFRSQILQIFLVQSKAEKGIEYLTDLVKSWHHQRRKINVDRMYDFQTIIGVRFAVANTREKLWNILMQRWKLDCMYSSKLSYMRAEPKRTKHIKFYTRSFHRKGSEAIGTVLTKGFYSRKINCC